MKLQNNPFPLDNKKPIIRDFDHKKNKMNKSWWRLSISKGCGLVPQNKIYGNYVKQNIIEYENNVTLKLYKNI